MVLSNGSAKPINVCSPDDARLPSIIAMVVNGKPGFEYITTNATPSVIDGPGDISSTVKSKTPGPSDAYFAATCAVRSAPVYLNDSKLQHPSYVLNGVSAKMYGTSSSSTVTVAG